MNSFLQDIRYGLRVLAKRPAFTLIAVLTLALGVGANTAIFSVVDAVLLRPLPYKQPDRLVFLSESSPQIPDMSISMANFNDWRSMNTVFESMAPYNFQPVVLTGQGEAERLRMRQITADLLPTLGVQPVLGRGLTPDDDKMGAAPVVLLSDGYWARKFARDPNVLGKKLILDGEIYTVIGVV
ncbi:MAG TPA: ABC transporter permease, partial [Candidatus Limnocylindrales bacterium]|nr:ABC transporter permease [Candidatus Limnocylindrales bacterium]